MCRRLTRVSESSDVLNTYTSVLILYHDLFYMYISVLVFAVDVLYMHTSVLIVYLPSPRLVVDVFKCLGLHVHRCFVDVVWFHTCTSVLMGDYYL